MPRCWFDAHLDLAYLAVNGRDMAGPVAAARVPHPPAAVTLPALAEGRGRFALATIFTEPVGGGGTGPECYPAGDAEAAHAVGRAQLAVYSGWKERGLIALDLADWLAGEAGAPARAATAITDEPAGAPPPRLRAAILMENADPIRSPAELGWWIGHGLAAVGLAWASGSRYAGGNATPGVGVSAIGRDLVGEMDRGGLLHDASHLSDRALNDLFAMTDRRVVATHSNVRALLGGVNERHLADAAIREIIRRGGLIGLNLYAPFIAPGEGGRPTIDDAIRHVEHVCELAGHRRGVGLGSDLDGGFGADRLPAGIDAPRDFGKLAEALRERGWGDNEVEGFAWANWARVLADTGAAMCLAR